MPWGGSEVWLLFTGSMLVGCLGPALGGMSGGFVSAEVRAQGGGPLASALAAFRNVRPGGGGSNGVGRRC